MDETSTKAIRRFLHLGKSVAPQVREQAARWGLEEMAAIHQLIRLGLRASREEATAGKSADAEVTRILSNVQEALIELLYVQVQSLLYCRDLAAEVTVLTAASTPEAREEAKKILGALDKRISANAKNAAGTIVDAITKTAAANRAKRSSGDTGGAVAMQ